MKFTRHNNPNKRHVSKRTTSIQIESAMHRILGEARDQLQEQKKQNKEESR